MDRSIYYCRFIFPVTGTMAVVLCFLIPAPTPVMIGMIITDILILLCADPFNAISRVLAPQTRHIITCCTITDVGTGYAYYYCHLAGYELPAGIAIFLGCLTLMLLFIAWKLNQAWLDRYLSLDCREVSCALVKDKEYKYIRYWDDKGRRICRSLLHMHLGRDDISDSEMEHTIRHVFIAGMASGDEYSSDLLKQIKSLQEKLAAAEKEQDKLQEHMDTAVKRKVAIHEEDLQYEIVQLKKRNTNLSTLNKDLSKQKTDAEKALKAANLQNQHLRMQCDQYQTDLSDLQETISSVYEPQIQHMEDLEKELHDLKNSPEIQLLEDLEDQRNILRTELQYIDQKNLYIQSLEKELEMLKKQLDEAINKIDMLEIEMAENESDYLAPVQTLPLRPLRPEHDQQKGGRPASLTDKQLAELIAERRAGVKVNVLAEKYKISKATVSRLCSGAAEQPEHQKQAL
ncbi:MAG: hypothetical protein PUG60_07465 [Lachnospiraceae bacterium]|nr:hypothetical protein [Lachnospiraceae bacterium]